MRIAQLPLSEIRTDGGTQMRAKLCPEAISDYAKAIGDRDKLPPVIVFRDSQGVYWLGDGFHRHKAYLATKQKTMPAEVRVGELRDAIRFALQANARHGLRRNNADKRKAVMACLEDPEWREYSATWIAEICAVSQPFVNRVVEEATHNGYELSQYVVSKDGKRRPRERSAKQAVSQPPAQKESTLILPATSEQIKTLSAAFMEMEDDAVESWLEPYAVEDWDELTRDQADGLIRDMQAAESEESAPDWLSEPEPDPAAEASPPEPSGDDDVEYCKVDGKRLRLTGDLAERWRQIRVAHEDIKTGELRTRNAVKTLASLSPGFRKSRGLERGPNQRWRKKSLEIEFTGLKEDAPHAPCPSCFATPRKGCIFCSESQFVSKRDWRGMVMDSEKNVLFKALEVKE